MDIRISLNQQIGSQVASGKQLYRVLHDIELPSGLRACAPCPEVFPLDGLHSPFGKSWQLLAVALNPGMTGNHFRSLYSSHEAFTNNSGFPSQAGDSPHADYVNNKDLTYADPSFDKTRFVGGATVTGVENGAYLMVDVLDSTNLAPTVEELRKFPNLFFHATIVTRNGIERFPQMNGEPVLVPLIGQKGAKYPLAALQKVPAIADPYFIGYRPSPYV